MLTSVREIYSTCPFLYGTSSYKLFHFRTINCLSRGDITVIWTSSGTHTDILPTEYVFI
jgi:hypothetical protein